MQMYGLKINYSLQQQIKEEKPYDHMNTCWKGIDKIQQPLLINALHKIEIKRNQWEMGKAMNEKYMKSNKCSFIQ